VSDLKFLKFPYNNILFHNQLVQLKGQLTKRQFTTFFYSQTDNSDFFFYSQTATKLNVA